MSAPAVLIKEIDLSTRVPSFPGVYAGIVIPGAAKGDPFTPRLVTSETDFLNQFTPDGVIRVGYDLAYFSALQELQKNNKLWVVRASAADATYGGAKINVQGTPNAALSAGEDDPEAHVFTTESFFLYGKDPGDWNDDVSYAIFNYKSSETVTVTTGGNAVFTVAQNWGTGYPVKLSSSGNMPTGLDSTKTYFVINVSATSIKLAATQAGALAGTAVSVTAAGTGNLTLKPAIQYTQLPNTFALNLYKGTDLNNPVESYVLSKTVGAKDGYGQNIYLQDRLLASNYVRALDNLLVSSAYVQDQVIPMNLNGGYDGSAVTDGLCIQAAQTLQNQAQYPMTIMLDGGRTTVAYQQALISLAETRQDCVAILSTPYAAEDASDYLEQIVDYRNLQLNANSSYAALYTPHVQIYDKFNDRNIFVAPDGFVGAQVSETAANYELWYPVGGNQRGVITAVDLKRRFTDGEMDYLYDNGINPIRYKAGKGMAIWGQKTLQSSPSSLDRLNVRLLLITIEPAVKEALEDFLFQFNDAATRATATALVKSYMDNIQARRGVYSYDVVCDTTNNSNDDIDNHIMNLWLFVQPEQSIEKIPFSVIITRTGTDFKLAAASL